MSTIDTQTHVGTRCNILDEGEYILAKGILLDFMTSDVIVELLPDKEYDPSSFLPGRGLTVRVFDTQNGLTSYRGRVTRLEGSKLFIGGCSIHTHEERRKDIKVMVNRDVFLITRERNHNNVEITQKISVVLYDISAGGVGIVTDQKLFPGREYEFVFDLGRDPDILTIVVIRKANVQVSGKTLYGCQFVDLHPMQESQVREFVFRRHLGPAV